MVVKLRAKGKTISLEERIKKKTFYLVFFLQREKGGTKNQATFKLVSL